ncbi:MAG: hypothetical protein VB853_00820, partial [Pirellulales bacterium]
AAGQAMASSKQVSRFKFTFLPWLSIWFDRGRAGGPTSINLMFDVSAAAADTVLAAVVPVPATGTLTGGSEEF